MSTASAVLRLFLMNLFWRQIRVPMSTASAVLRHCGFHCFKLIKWYLCLPLRRYWDNIHPKMVNVVVGTYVYRFGGIETFLCHIPKTRLRVVPMSTASAVLRHLRIRVRKWNCWVPMSTASAVLRQDVAPNKTNKKTRYLCLPLRRYWDNIFFIHMKISFGYLCLPLRRYWDILSIFLVFILFGYLCLPLRRYWDGSSSFSTQNSCGTYVYRFGGIETFILSLHAVITRWYLCLPLRRYWDVFIIYKLIFFRYLCLPLRRYWDTSNGVLSYKPNNGTYVYRFGGIET